MLVHSSSSVHFSLLCFSTFIQLFMSCLQMQIPIFQKLYPSLYVNLFKSVSISNFIFFNTFAKQANHRVTTTMQRRIYGHATNVEIRPLDEEKAVQAAVDLLGEAFVFSVLLIFLLDSVMTCLDSYLSFPPLLTVTYHYCSNKKIHFANCSRFEILCT